MEEDERDCGEVLEGKGIGRRWGDAELLELHEHVISHLLITEDLYRCVMLDPNFQCSCNSRFILN